MTMPLYRQLVAALQEGEDDGEIRTVVLTGAGRAFSVGADLKAHGEAEVGPAQRKAYVEAGQEANRALQRCPLPVVAAVNGHAVGAGLELALSADFLVVAEEARLRFPEAALGTFVGGGVSWTLPRRVGLARARELLLLAHFFTPAEAREMGLATRVLPSSQVLNAALELAGTLAARAPRSLALLKELLRDGVHAHPDTLMDREAHALLECMGTRDWAEGVQAFAEKREPHFTGE